MKRKDYRHRRQEDLIDEFLYEKHPKMKVVYHSFLDNLNFTNLKEL